MSESRYCLDCYAAHRGAIVATEWDDEDPLCLPCFNARTKRSADLAVAEDAPRWTLDQIRDAYLNCSSVKKAAEALGTSEATLRKFVREHGVEDQWAVWYRESSEDDGEVVTHQREQTVTHKESVVVKRKPRQPVFETGGKERMSAVTLQLRSGGYIRMELNVHLFGMSLEDRDFVFGIADRMKAYEDGKLVRIPAPEKFSIMPSVEEGFVRDMFSTLEPEQQRKVVEWLKSAAVDWQKAGGK